MVLKDLSENVYNRFFSFSGNKISRYITSSVLNCKQVENILHIFCLRQSWLHFTSLKSRGHIKFVLCKKSQEYFQLCHNLVHLKKYIERFDFEKREKPVV